MSDPPDQQTPQPHYSPPVHSYKDLCRPVGPPRSATHPTPTTTTSLESTQPHHPRIPHPVLALPRRHYHELPGTLPLRRQSRSPLYHRRQRYHHRIRLPTIPGIADKNTTPRRLSYPVYNIKKCRKFLWERDIGRTREWGPAGGVGAGSLLQAGAGVVA